MDWKSFGFNAFQTIMANVVMGTLGTYVRTLPVDRLNGFMVRFGRAFGPPGIRHFSELSQLDQSKLLARVPVLRTNHSDWLKPFQWVPRTLTVWTGPAPTIDDVKMGVVTPPLKPLPNRGEWYVLPGYLASTTVEGVHDRLGWRWDDIDGYFELSVALKRV